MKKRIISMGLMLVVLIAVLSGCGSSKSASQAAKSDSAPMYAQNAETAANGGMAGSRDTAAAGSGSQTAPESKTAAGSITAVTGTGASRDYVSNPILNERKIIRNANVTVEAEDFDKAYGQLEFIIAGIGYVQETKINKDKYYISGKEVLKTRGTIVIRVDAEKFGSVLKDVKGLGLLLDENIKSDDVTDKFFDIESRLRLVKYEESRLEEYLKKVTEPETIFKTEARLTEIRHEIESLTGNLNKLSSLVELSTITVNMSEKVPAGEKTNSYWQKLSSSFSESLRGVVRFCGELVIFIVAASPVLALIFAVAFAAFVVYKKFIKKPSNFNAQKENKDNDN